MKNWFLPLFLLFGISASAQLNEAGDSAVINFLDASSHCLINMGLPNNGGQINADPTTF